MACFGKHLESVVGEKAPGWRGGKWEDGQGYVLRGRGSFSAEEFAVVGPMFNNSAGVLEHRAVKALELGRPLLREETVHHKNGVRNDNRPENLEVWLRGHTIGFSSNMSLCCPECGHTSTAHEFFKAFHVVQA